MPLLPFSVAALIAEPPILSKYRRLYTGYGTEYGNMTGENMTGKVSGFGPELLSDNTAPRSECPVDAEGIERCGPQGPPETDSNGDTNGNGDGDASGDGKTVQMAMEMVTINKDLVKIMVIPLVAAHSFLLFPL
jgi:hypothetical protein